eukprot:CAMPEP_0185178390 /NCGR_PEP_ID=MMETSP1139-20130426/31114_1 /TAXON_ID=298111 /ORGANISM="Pavlova sp., Strain CCMP459" /LENGTH=377 /DNA_ID=CAMNT_0027744207 /DNA_START=21 /DNA_END=1150 /DNA_ORIENTATION=-
MRMRTRGPRGPRASSASVRRPRAARIQVSAHEPEARHWPGGPRSVDERVTARQGVPHDAEAAGGAFAAHLTARPPFAVAGRTLAPGASEACCPRLPPDGSASALVSVERRRASGPLPAAMTASEAAAPRLLRPVLRVAPLPPPLCVRRARVDLAGLAGDEVVDRRVRKLVAQAAECGEEGGREALARARQVGEALPAAEARAARVAPLAAAAPELHAREREGRVARPGPRRTTKLLGRDEGGHGRVVRGRGARLDEKELAAVAQVLLHVPAVADAQVHVRALPAVERSQCHLDVALWARRVVEGAHAALHGEAQGAAEGVERRAGVVARVHREDPLLPARQELEKSRVLAQATVGESQEGRRGGRLVHDQQQRAELA